MPVYNYLFRWQVLFFFSFLFFDEVRRGGRISIDRVPFRVYPDRALGRNLKSISVDRAFLFFSFLPLFFLLAQHLKQMGLAMHNSFPLFVISPIVGNHSAWHSESLRSSVFFNYADIEHFLLPFPLAVSSP